ncbi:class C beta-lactamase [Arenibaculum sp.]|jgi:beta-lactamase class C|uniref:class C beta-lactamase n=1 Tax=Arenibaculum sp. TaxID=2865862 RepID=UPI002E0D4F1F|nr:class C beta-lactamase [Arenibaculum sp.]
MNSRAILELGLAVAAASFLAAGGPAAAGDAAGPVAAVVDEAVLPLMREHEVPGMAVAVTIDGRRHFMNYGVASRETNGPVTEDTLFELGSISKTFTGMLASYAQVLGKMSLDDNPGRYMPELRGSAVDRARLIDLGTYTAGGLPLQFPDGVRTHGRMVAYFRQWRPEAAPGETRRYSNPSIGLLGHVTGLALGGSFEEALEGELLAKLGLGHTHVRVPTEKMGDYAWGYRADRPVRVSPGMFDAQAYGVKSSAADMIRFVEANIRPDTLDDTIRRAVEGTHVGYFSVGGMVQGLGWEQYPYPVTLERLLAGNSRTMAMEANAAAAVIPPRAAAGATLYNKTGSTNGFGAYVAFVPERRIGIVMLANRNVPIPARIEAAHAILETLAARAE